MRVLSCVCCMDNYLFGLGCLSASQRKAPSSLIKQTLTLKARLNPSSPSPATKCFPLSFAFYYTLASRSHHPPLCHTYCATPSLPPPFFLTFSHPLRRQTPSPAPPSPAPTTAATPHVCRLHNATPPHTPFSLYLPARSSKLTLTNDHTAPPSRRSRSWIRQQRCASRSTDSAQAVSGSIKAQATVRANSTW